MAKYFPHALALIFIPFWIYFSIEPFDRTIWWAENLPVLLIVLGLILSFRSFRFSNVAYALMAFWIFWHTVGGHYTFERVPFDFFTEFFGFERNHFDRFGHFFVGFFAFPIAEFMKRKKFITHQPSCYLFALFAIVTLAAFYELIEWWFAILFEATEGGMFLGSQGDIWDAQKDILCDTLGAVVALVIFWLWKRAKD